MRKNIYFISDAHLAFRDDEPEQAKRQQLIDFLGFVKEDKNAQAIYLLGDIFDFWFEWYHVVPKYWFPVLHRLRELVDAGIEVNFVTGNHDFYRGSYLEKEIGIRCFDESHSFERGGKRFFAAHGDGYAAKDRGYRLLKRIIRSPLSIFLFKTFVPADWGMQIARWFSNSSRKLVKIEKHAWAEEYYKYAQKKFGQGFDYVILGHIHFPMKRQEQGKTYINCGDWIAQFTYARYDGRELTLNQWNAEKNKGRKG